MTAVRTLAGLERAEFAALLHELTPEQWSVSSLCEGWTVRDVVAHTIAYLGQSRARLIMNMVRTRFDIDRLNAKGLRDSAGLAPEQLIRLMHQGGRPSGAAALYGGRVALIECLIHQQDIRRPLGLLRTIPEERLRVSLNFARFSPVIGGARRTHGARLVATDMDWSAGRGPEVRGTGEALLLAMTGRAESVAGELAGEGTTLLR
ncbi:maleylpyruvate isomerase family mycothiol-dependent enzyme [Mycolicibacterium komossense]|uniref:Maleylpyruvate isomerase family mycothiol-dependent enzyme n=1 Tax=Mycolicibacterium komossense TaxID=1779 RepID=A0ABT3CET2_9MYCO|nr:maleylpyruvate isomerase family mycothiol-dependent enzyme [Mycolicibacterium komossense]MCV7227994.1 maleylpyruvate isomerase family mycothiol-dependent enzyme [Mycolicibacterium komossense]